MCPLKLHDFNNTSNIPKKKLVTHGNIKFIKICAVVLSLLYVHRETDRERERDTETERERETDTHRGRERERQTDRHTMKLAGIYFQLFIATYLHNQ